MGEAALLDRPSYLFWEVDRLVGLPAGTARRWINGYQRSGKRYAPILREQPSSDEWVTWGEFVEARILAEFRDQRVPTTKLRAAVDRLRYEYQVAYPLALMRPYLEAEQRRLLIDDGPDRGKRDLITGQRILDSGTAVALSAVPAQDASGELFVAELPLDADFPTIWTNPDRMSGQPTVGRRRIAAVTVAGMVEAGESDIDVAMAYNISPENVRDAVKYARKYRLAA